MLREQKQVRDQKKVLQKALQPYRGMYLLTTPNVLVPLLRNTTTTRAENVQVIFVEVHTAATNSEKSVPWYMRTNKSTMT
jgi:hypothetical protein